MRLRKRAKQVFGIDRSSNRLRDRVLTRRRFLQLQMLERRDLLAGDFNYGVGDELRTYRLAVATTAEYTAAIGGTSAALASVQQLVQDLNAIYRPELAIEFDLVSGLNTIFTDSNTDGFSNGSLST